MRLEKDNLKEVSFPLGGIGSGCIGLSGNGRLIDWEIFNRPNKQSVNGWSHFAVRCLDDSGVVDARVLVSDELDNFCGAKDSYGSGVNFFSMNGFPYFKNNTFEGNYPLAKLCFYDEHFPSKVELKAFNPFIPLDSKNSSIPSAFFEIEFENTTEKELTFEAALSVSNPFKKTINIASDKQLVLYDGENKEKTLPLLPIVKMYLLQITGIEVGGIAFIRIIYALFGLLGKMVKNSLAVIIKKLGQGMLVQFRQR